MVLNEEKWVNKAKKGSKKAFDQLVNRYAGRIFGLLYDMTRNQEDAEDLTQETFLRAYLKIKQYRGDSKFSTWLYRIAYNAGIDFRRQIKRSTRVDMDTKEDKIAVQNWTSSSGAGEFTGEREEIEKALETLTHPQKMAVVLHYYHGLKMKEIGDILNISESTVRVQLFRAIGHLKRKLKDLDPGVEL
jgi:RNA polymerase sigma-70 factor (ECF subfamily)